MLRLFSLAALCSLSLSLLSQSADLSLTLTQSPGTPAQYSVYQVTAAVTNDGPAAATGVAVAVPAPAGVVYEGGNEASASQGAFAAYGPGAGTWDVGALASGATATLTVNYFLLDAAAPASYAEVAASDQADPDSTPGNGTAPVPNEDDEASTLINGGFVPDLTLANLTLLANPVDSGQQVDFTFDIVNQGAGSIAQTFLVQAYFSVDDQLSPDDLQNGTVPTGNFAGGQTVAGVIGAAIPQGLSPGQYFLILEADANGQVLESDETNNTIAVPLTIEAGAGPSAGCGFATTLPTPTGFGRRFGREVANGYEVDREFDRATLSDEGSLLDLTALPDIPEAATQLPRAPRGELVGYTRRGSVLVTYVAAADGALLDSLVFDPGADVGVTPVDPSTLAVTGATPTSYGYFVLAAYRPQSSPAGTRLLGATFDATGSLTAATEFDSVAVDRDALISFVDDVRSDGLVLASYRTSGRTNVLFAVDANLGVRYETGRVGDLVTNRIGGAAFSADGTLVYYGYRDQSPLSVTVVGFDAADGSPQWVLRPTGRLVGAMSTFGIIGRPFALANGDAAVLYAYRDIGGPTVVEAARVDAAGDLVWATDVSSEVARGSGEAVLETSDGEIVFVAEEEPVVLQLTADGELSPDCAGGAPATVDLSLDGPADSPAPPIYQLYRVEYVVANTGTAEATDITVDLPAPAGVVYEGGHEYTATQGFFEPYGDEVWVVGSLPAGEVARITVSYFTLTSSGFVLEAEVATQDQVDADSTPGNAAATGYTEDDENRAVISSAASVAQLRLNPNPARNGRAVTLQFDLTRERSIPILISDLQGRIVEQVTLPLGVGFQQVTLPTERLGPGVYVVAIPDSGLTPQRLVISK